MEYNTELPEILLQQIEHYVDGLRWEDIEHLYDNGIVDPEEHDCEEMHQEIIDESLTAIQRIKKRFDFLKSKAKRDIALQLALHRTSSQNKLKKRAIVHARQLIVQRLLKGRDKNDLSPAEKSRIEDLVHKAKDSVIRISNRLIPKIRELEMRRLRHQHNTMTEENQRTDNVYDSEEHAVKTVAANDTDTEDNPILARIKYQLEGGKDRIQPIFPHQQRKTFHKMRHFRKLEV